MDNSDIIKELTEVSERSKSNTHRINRLEETQDELRSLATSTAVMAQEMSTVKDNVSDIKTSVGMLTDKVNEIKEKPIKRLDGLWDKLLWLVIGAAAAWVLAQIGISV